ncbi:MAG: PIN domain nuclease [Verrucomicrobia bacterium]|nr:MAG: PIN domain nuclease [Verrucomicrobiota bacterium]
MAATRARRVAMTGLLDTNVALYLLGGQLAEPLPAGSYGVSVITEMELLAWPSLTIEEEKKIREFLGQLIVCELTPSIRGRAVQLRKEQHLKLPDAVVCATAMEFGVELWTNDASLAKVPGLNCRAVNVTKI